VNDVDDLSGSTLAGRFRLVRQLGRGGMGAVYLAEDLQADIAGVVEPVAVKVIKSTLLDDASAIKRFEREAVAVGKLNHPHIVGFRGTGSFAGVNWMAMEYLEGQSLRERIANTGAIPWRESLAIMAQIVDGLAAAHAQGVVHRDLKPDNVMLATPAPGATPHVKLLDFGIAKQVDAEAMTMTGTGMIVGTPGFIAPEVIVHGIADDPRSDLYALGVVWFEMITATKPFDAPTPFALAVKHVQEAPPRPNDVRPFSPVPPPVEAAILLLLEKSPDRRPASAVALGNLLQKLIHDADHPHEPATSTLRTENDLANHQRTETGFAAFSPPPPPLSSAPTVLSARPKKSTPVAAIAAVVVVIALVVVVGIVTAVGRALPEQLVLTVVDGGIAVSTSVDAGVAVVDAGVGAVVIDAGVVEVVDAGVAAPVVKHKPAKGDTSHKPKLMLD